MVVQPLVFPYTNKSDAHVLIDTNAAYIYEMIIIRINCMHLYIGINF